MLYVAHGSRTRLAQWVLDLMEHRHERMLHMVRLA
eukprot:SAG31_NODE_24639_length_477_cov_0.907407_1_plen_34_part_10